MDEDIDITFQKQAEALPSEIRKYIVSGVWEKELNTIIQQYKLSEETASVLGREVILVLTGLTTPQTFRGDLVSEIHDVDNETIDTIVVRVTASIFNPIRAILEKFLAEQDSSPDGELPKEKEKITIPAPPSLVEPQKIWEKVPSVIPENLPTGEVIPSMVLPEQAQHTVPPASGPLSQTLTPSNTTSVDNQLHPFEEKMKKVFTGGVVDRGGLVLDQKTPPIESTPIGVSVARPAHDPYREPIE